MLVEAAVVEHGDVGGHHRCVALDLQIADKRPSTNLPAKRLTHENPKMCHENAQASVSTTPATTQRKHGEKGTIRCMGLKTR